MQLLRFAERMETRITRSPRSANMSRSEVAVILFRLEELARVLATLTDSVNRLSDQSRTNRSQR